MRLAERVLPWRILRRKTAGWPLMRMIGWDLAGACGAGAWGVGALLAMVLLSRLPREFYGGLPESVLLILLGVATFWVAIPLMVFATLQRAIDEGLRAERWRCDEILSAAAWLGSERVKRCQKWTFRVGIIISVLYLGYSVVSMFHGFRPVANPVLVIFLLKPFEALSWLQKKVVLPVDTETPGGWSGRVGGLQSEHWGVQPRRWQG